MSISPVYDIWRILSCPRDQVEWELRALSQAVYLGEHEALCRVLGRYKMFVDTRDMGVSCHLMMDGFWEIWVTAAMMQCVRRGSVVADIGANNGYFTLLLADLVGPKGRVLSFEPNPEMTKLLRKSISANGIGGFTHLHQMALGADVGLGQLHVDRTLPGGACPIIVDNCAEQGSKPVMSANAYYGKQQVADPVSEQPAFLVPIQRFDEIDGALEVDFIKIDVEGFEQAVWSGMTKLLASNRPLTIFMEFTLDRFDNPDVFLNDVESYGFQMELIDYQCGIQPITREALFSQPHYIDHMLVFRRTGAAV